MSEPIAERLSRFTPDATTLDRDALLFAAGRASVRPSRRWKALAGLLAACQLLTLVLLWPQPAPLAPVPVAITVPGPSVETPLPPVPESSTLGALSAQALASEGNLPLTVSTEPLVPDEPPLRAFGAPPAALLQ